MKRRPQRQSNKARRRNQFAKRPPNVKEVRDAQKLAGKVSKELLEMMEAKPDAA
jgi:hypothetical protein